MFCVNCGAEIVSGAKFCQVCGHETVLTSSNKNPGKRQSESAGKLYKCPGCGEVLNSFETACPACGLELRGVKAAGAVREFALKLEVIEANREYEKPTILKRERLLNEISKTDAQKISLIK